MKTHYIVLYHGLACGKSQTNAVFTQKQSEVTCGNCIRYLRQFKPRA